jgi:hypothetical protein
LADTVDRGSYRIRLDADWSLKDFYELPHVFAQVYAFNCAFLIPDKVRDLDRLTHTFSSYPWRGGYSAVNFYNVLGYLVPQRLRPKVKSIKYASPGWIELSLVVSAALAIGKVIDIFVKSAGGLNALYTDVHRGMRDRKLMRIDVKQKEIELAKAQIDFAIKSSQLLAKGLGFENLDELNERTGHPLASLKSLMSYYRRVRVLAEYAIKGKAEFPADEAIKGKAEFPTDDELKKLT